MKIYLNQQALELDIQTLAELIAVQNLDPQGLAAAVNSQIVPRSEWAATALQEQDNIQLFRAIAGG